jgi:hypothetical protein
MRRKWIYPSDGSPAYEVPVDHRGRVVNAPVVHIFEPVEGSDGRLIASKRELERQNAAGKSIHVEDLRNVAQDAHNEKLRQAQRDKLARKRTLADVMNGMGL